MSIERATGSEVAVSGGDQIEGLEDVDQSDLTTPIIKIDHEEGVFIDSLTNERFSEFDAVLLGLVKQRVLWPPTPGADGEGPMCRSVNHAIGSPDAAKWVVKHNGITAQAVSGFTFDEVQEGDLPCSSCKLKEWESHPNNNTPWCNEQYVFPLIRIMEDGTQAAALIHFQRTGLKPCKSYVSGFVAARRPLYTAITRVAAVHQRKGTVEYVTPSFSKLSDSDPSEFPSYSSQYHDIKTFITSPRSRPESTTPVADPKPSAPPASQVADEPMPVQRAEPVQTPSDDEEPF